MASDPSMSNFVEACGLDGPLVVEVSGPGIFPALLELTQPFALIGTDPRADFHLEDSEVGRHHALLQVIAGHVFCVELDNGPGTQLSDGQRATGWLTPGESFQIGPVQLRLPDGVARPVAWSPLRPHKAKELPASPFALEFLSGKAKIRQWQVDRSLTLFGSAERCKIRLASRTVAPLHCYLVATPGGVWIVDLLSASGVLHNGTSVRFARLEDGDQLLIGEFLMRVHQERPVQAMPPAVAPSSGGGAMVTSHEAALVPIMNQFSLMQQQMFDQFQQTMMMMFQMFGTLQQKQMDALRDELDRVQDLTRELQDLQSQLEKSASTASIATPPPTPSPAKPAPMPAAANPSAAPSPPRQPGPPTPDPENMHSWLYQRMETVRQERQSRWQTILGMLGGKNS
jgi:pSer/pThr/pTyr-binding forkhead associated (FHA) protein